MIHFQLNRYTFLSWKTLSPLFIKEKKRKKKCMHARTTRLAPVSTSIFVAFRFLARFNQKKMQLNSTHTFVFFFLVL